MPPDDSRQRIPYPRISLRSLLLVMGGVAVLSALIVPYQLGHKIWPYHGMELLRNYGAQLLLYFVAWLIPAMSIGYDNSPSKKGLLFGAAVGFALAETILDALRSLAML